jgi:tetratricopeptide (TPR) repeat protein
MKSIFTALILLFLGTSPILLAQGPPSPPLTEKEVIKMLKSKEEHQVIGQQIMERGVDFEMTPEIEKKLRKAKAEDQFIEVVKQASPAARAARAGSGGASAVTPDEARAMQAIRQELDPERTIQLVKDFELKYPNSSLLTWVYTFAATAYQQKNDIAHVVEYGEKSLKLKSDNLLSLIIMAAMLPQPQMLRSGELDKVKKLTQAENYANEALKLIDKLPRQPNETDDAYQRRKGQLGREPHAALGMVHLERSSMGLEGPDKDELEKAEQEYETAVSMGERPDAQDYFRLGETRVMLKKWDAAIEAFTKAGELGQGTMIKTYSDKRIADIEKQKAAHAPATP